MKNLFLIGGTMGVGKTTTCRILEQKLNHSVFLDGDWCWDMHPFQVTEETKRMVVENICFLLNNFIRCSAYENIVFCWVMHQQAIIDDILSRLEMENCKIHTISLMCGERALRDRLQKDVSAGVREEEVIQRSVARLPLYRVLDTEKIDVSKSGPEEAADLILSITQKGESQHD
ncbi:MAG: AAA family ATPase [Lawsonibacter sp.]|nr:AAA family ATPase [Lawsonibacter sp.]